MEVSYQSSTTVGMSLFSNFLIFTVNILLRIADFLASKNEFSRKDSTECLIPGSWKIEGVT